MKPEHAEAASAAASAAGGVLATKMGKLSLLWSGVAAGFLGNPFGWAASGLAALYSIHLIVGWWLDRLGISLRRPRGPHP